jgi:uncharacterized membrane protein YkgB
MITIEVFLAGLLICSAFTGLVTEGVKKILEERNKTYHANTLAGLVAVILSAAFAAGYIMYTGAAFSQQIFVCIIALVFLSWLSAMVGYDKVIQAINQFAKK